MKGLSGRGPCGQAPPRAPQRGAAFGSGVCTLQLQSQVTSHKSQVTGHKTQGLGPESQVTGAQPQVTGWKGFRDVLNMLKVFCTPIP